MVFTLQESLGIICLCKVIFTWARRALEMGNWCIV